MITAQALVELLRRFVLLDDEPVEWTKEYPDGPAVDVETSDRTFSVRVAHDLLRIEREPWVEAVVVADREDQLVEGPPPRETWLVPRDGEAVDLGDPAAVAALGARVTAGALDPLAFAEILVHCQWPGGWFKTLVREPDAWRAQFPAEAPLPPVEAPRLADEGDELELTFAASRQQTRVVAGRPVLDVARWSVRLGSGPATWTQRVLAESVPLQPPWGGAE